MVKFAGNGVVVFAQRSVTPEARVKTPPAAERENVNAERSRVPSVTSTFPVLIVTFAPRVLVLGLEIRRFEYVVPVTV